MIINHTLRYSTSVLVILVTFMMLSVPAERILAQTVLENEKLKVQFHEQGIAEIRDKALNRSITLDEAPFRVILADHKITDGTTSFREQISSQHTVSFHYQSGVFNIEAVYELRPGWRFVSKRLVLSTSRTGYRVEEMQPFRMDLQNEVAEEYLHKDGRYGAFLRFADKEGRKPEYGAFWALQNPFMQWEQEGTKISMSYSPKMEWHSEYGDFTSDRVLIGTYELSGQTYPVNRVPEWKYHQHPETQTSREPQIDYSEIEALTECVEAFLLYNPKESLRVHVGWTENDFQINTAMEQGRREYKRIIDQAAAVGVQHILYTPDHTGLTDLEENRDA